MPYSDTRQDCQMTFPHTRPYYAKSSCQLIRTKILQWKLQPGRPRAKWIDRLHHDNNNALNVPITATLWRQAIGRRRHSTATLYGPTRLRANVDDDDDENVGASCQDSVEDRKIIVTLTIYWKSNDFFHPTTGEHSLKTPLNRPTSGFAPANEYVFWFFRAGVVL